MKWLSGTSIRIRRQTLILYGVLILLCAGSMVFVFNNHAFYDTPIAKVIRVEPGKSEEVTDTNGNSDRLFTQRMIAELKNGPYKGEQIHLENTYSLSKAFDQEHRAGDELFVHIAGQAEDSHVLAGDIEDVKRDYYMMGAFWLFLFVLTVVGKKKGLFAVLSLAINMAILVLAVELYVRTGVNLLLIAAGLAVLFTILSLLFLNGFNEKTYAAILSTLLGTAASLSVTLLVIRLTDGNGLHYEELQFLTRPYETVFLAGLFIGSLGAVMDVAITMSASVFELWEKNPRISMDALRTSGMDIGRDIMGTMTSILFFAYISGSIPMLILYFKNASPFGYTLSINLSLELARALSGGIGIVLTIPIGLYISMFFVRKKRAES
ncbi:YibE/F family protein [Bhargavaea beijingensis]|nr:YibE/F family protein [Bhargavaea beijingensis]MCW1928039.1 YibE/F family protein [Bhargavaea beijingensis]